MKQTFKTKICSIALGTMTAFSVMVDKPAAAGPDPYIGDVMLFGAQWCPVNWKEANGELLSVATYNPLFTLYGTMYGGDGRTTFGLPDLRGRVPIHVGQGPGLKNYQQGQKGGAESLTFQTNNIPSHSHNVNAVNDTANQDNPKNAYLAEHATNFDLYYTGTPQVRIMDPAMIKSNTGGSQAITKRSPYQAIRWCVSLLGRYPSKN